MTSGARHQGTKARHQGTKVKLSHGSARKGPFHIASAKRGSDVRYYESGESGFNASTQE
jgi:hypothetical protein